MENQPLVPLPPEKWPAELEAVRASLGTPLNVHNIMAHNAALTLAWMPLRHYIVANSSLDARHRELLILRTAANCGAGYEWEHHVVRGRAAGLTDEEIGRVRQGPGAAGWSEAEAALLQAADECHADYRISGDTLDRLSRHFDHKEQLDIVATVGMYTTLALIIRTWDVPLEADG